jgi:Domain of unknown function (DUF4145)
MKTGRSVAEGESKETLLANCEHCEATVAGVVEGSYQRYIDGPDCSYKWSLLKRPSCQSPILVAQDDEDARYMEEPDEPWSKPKRLYPLMSDRQLGFAVPEPIRAAFAEARACYTEARAHTACAIMCRKVLEGICESHGATGGNLAQRLKQLSESGQLDKRLFEWTDAVRLVGNEAAHDVNITVSREDAGDLLDLAEAVAEYLYTIKEKFEAFNKRRSAKASGKS